MRSNPRGHPLNWNDTEKISMAPARMTRTIESITFALRVFAASRRRARCPGAGKRGPVVWSSLRTLILRSGSSPAGPAFAPFFFWKIFVYTFPGTLRIVRTLACRRSKGLGEGGKAFDRSDWMREGRWKIKNNGMPTAGIEPATFRSSPDALPN